MQRYETQAHHRIPLRMRKTCARTVIRNRCDVMILTMTSNDIVMTSYDTNRTFRAMLLTSGVQILGSGFLHHPILWLRVRLSDGLTTTTMSSMMALLYVDVIWTFRDMSEFRFSYLRPTNRTFHAMLLTSGVRILGRGFLHHPVLRLWIRLSDGSITTTM